MAAETTLRNDPLRNFKFLVLINKMIATQGGGSRGALLAKAGFMSVNGLGVQTELIRYREGGFNTTTHKLPGQSDFPNITLQRGVIVGGGNDGGRSQSSPAFWQWQKELFYYLQGKAPIGGGGQAPDFRTMVTIYVLDHPRTNAGPQGNAMGFTVDSDVNNPRGIDRLGIRLHNAWPTATNFNDLDAGANAIMVEQMQLAHEGIEVVFDTDGNGAKSKFRNSGH